MGGSDVDGPMVLNDPVVCLLGDEWSVTRTTLRIGDERLPLKGSVWVVTDNSKTVRRGVLNTGLRGLCQRACKALGLPADMEVREHVGGTMDITASGLGYMRKLSFPVTRVETVGSVTRLVDYINTMASAE